MLNWRVEIDKTNYTIRFNPQNGEVTVNVMPMQTVMKHGARGIQYGFMIGKHQCDITPVDDGYRLMVDGKTALKSKNYTSVSNAQGEAASIFRRRREHEAKSSPLDMVSQVIPDWLWFMLIPVSLIPVFGNFHPNALLLWGVGVVVLLVIANLPMLKVTTRQAVAYMIAFCCWSIYIILASRGLL